MAKKKTGSLDETEKTALLAIERGPNQMKLLKKAARLFGRPYGALYAAWATLLKLEGKWGTTGKVGRPSSKAPVVATQGNNAVQDNNTVVPVPAAKGDKIVFYVLEEGAEVGPRGETEMLRERIKPLVNAMDVYDPRGTRHAIPIETSKVGSIRSWLTQEFPDKTFAISSIAGNDKGSRITRKS
jgi:hypothetical protein